MAALLLVGVGAGLAVLGWRPRPTDDAIVEAIRSCVTTNLTNEHRAALATSGRTMPDAATAGAWGAELAATRQAKVALWAVDRNWVHEILGRSSSRFLVVAAIEVPGKPRIQGCFEIQPLGEGAAFAFGPYSRWRCYSPL